MVLEARKTSHGVASGEGFLPHDDTAEGCVVRQSKHASQICGLCHHGPLPYNLLES